MHKLYRHLCDLKKSPSIILTDSNSETIMDTSGIASSFNDFLHSTFTLCDFVLPQIEHLPTLSDQFYSIDIDPCVTYNALANLNPLKAMGCGNLSTKVLKRATSLSDLSLLSSESVSNIQEWKMPKPGDPCLITNHIQSSGINKSLRFSLPTSFSSPVWLLI